MGREAYGVQDGRPVYIEQLGGIDLNAMYKITSADRMLQNLVVEYEKLADPRLPACSRKAGSLLETCCTIVDMKGVGISKAPSVYSYVQKTSAILQNYYPERLGKLYIINAPWGFASVFSVVKGFLDPVTVQKIHVLGAGYQAELQKQVPKENLPEILGGTCHCEQTCALSDLGPWREEEWYRPAAWEKDEGKEEAAPDAIENEPSEIVTGGEANNATESGGPTTAPEEAKTQKEGAPAPA